ncbi:MAG TPA: hypothetical protein VMV93_04260 [Chloroflexota bacterium]|nr:hypothetical protein [Chloroflexota bacterium]
MASVASVGSMSGGPVGAGASIFSTGAPLAASMGAAAALAKPGQWPGAHELLAAANGSQLGGLLTSVDTRNARQLANLLQQHIDALTNNTTGTPAGVQPVHGVINGAANIQQGIAVISGQLHA